MKISINGFDQQQQQHAITITSDDNPTEVDRRQNSGGDTTLRKFRVLNYTLADNGTVYDGNNISRVIGFDLKGQCQVNLNREKHDNCTEVIITACPKGNPDVKVPFVDICLFFKP